MRQIYLSLELTQKIMVAGMKVSRNICLLLTVLIMSLSSALASPASATWMQGKYGVFVHYLNGVNNISGDTSSSATSWNNTLYAFNTDTFAQQVYATGASYVVVTIGQTNGFYCIGSTTFLNVTGQTGYCGGRNLLLDIYDSLHNPANTGGVAKDIKMMVYLASEGPSGAPSNVSGSNAFNCAYGYGPRNANFRSNFNAMIREWSLALGTKISGWWLDGTWSYWKTSYNSSGYLVYDEPGDGTRGIDNLNALITACRAGNASAVVGCNTQMLPSGPNGYTTQADFATGEFNRFCRTPMSPTVTVSDVSGTSTLQWAQTSFLGTWWAEPSATSYTNLQLSNYIYFVTKAKGTLMLDMAVYRDGSLSSAQRTQMSAVNTAVNVNKTYTDYSFQSGGSTLKDFAAFKPSWFMSNNGTTELDINSSSQYMSYGNDAEASVPANFAIAGGEWAYNYKIDLGASKQFNYYVLTMPSTNYATNFNVEGSTNGTSWVVLKNVTTTSGGRKEGYLNATYNYRYVRVKAATPNGPGQSGVQMGITEFELYKY
jgi:hypothetical protein